MPIIKKFWWIIPFAVGFACWLTCQYWPPELLNVLDRKNELKGPGTFGDSYGALNTLFSGLAFAGIIISIILQPQELKDTREETKSQKEQLERHEFISGAGISR